LSHTLSARFSKDCSLILFHFFHSSFGGVLAFSTMAAAAAAAADQSYQEMLRQQVLATKKGPHGKTESLSRSTRLLEKRKEQLEVQQELDDHKSEFQRQEEQMKKREMDLKKRERELQEELVKYHKFLNDNDTKRVDAERKQVDNKKFLDQKEEEIEQLKVGLKSMRTELADKKQVLDSYRKYQQFFKTVLEKTDEYKEVKLLIERWNTLSVTRTGLQQQQEATVRETEKQRVQLQKYVEEQVNDVLGLNNQIAGLQKTLETMNELTIQQESTLEERSDQTATRTQEYTQVKMACENIYRRMLERANQRHKKLDLLQQLDVVQELLADYKDIVVKGNKLYPAAAKKPAPVL